MVQAVRYPVGAPPVVCLPLSPRQHPPEMGDVRAILGLPVAGGGAGEPAFRRRSAFATLEDEPEGKPSTASSKKASKMARELANLGSNLTAPEGALPAVSMVRVWGVRLRPGPGCTRTLTHPPPPPPPPPPPQVPSRALVLGGLKAKRDVRASKKWEWKPFVSSHRRDLSLSHWARADAEASDYAFAKFNRRIDVLRYTPEEYVRTCSPSPTSTDPADVDLRWQEGATPEAFAAGQAATDALFELVRRFDMRWPVIADRFPSTWGYKTVEVRSPPPDAGAGGMA